ncbi:hypothetical protein OESDEN_13935, partial [Oesophagostomum dentatum]
EQKGEEAQLVARNHDVQFFKRRFPKCLHTTADNTDVFTFNYQITDPDWEPSQDVNVDPSKLSSIPPLPATAPPKKQATRIIPVKVVVTREQKGEEAQLVARNHDVQFFKRRFPKCLHTTADNTDVFTFNYQITDPDWVFDVRSIKFRITLQSGHPVDFPALEVSHDNRALPDLLISHIESGCNEALKERYATFESKNAFEPVGKLFVRWLDRNILSLFVEGLKKTKLVKEAEAAGIRLVVPDPSSAQTIKGNEATGEQVEFAQKDLNSEVPLSENMVQLVISDEDVNANGEDEPENLSRALPLQSSPQIEAEAAGIRLVVPDPSSAQTTKEDEATGEQVEFPQEDLSSEVPLSEDMVQLVISDEDVNGNSEDEPENLSLALPLQSTPQIEVVLIWRDSRTYFISRMGLSASEVSGFVRRSKPR